MFEFAVGNSVTVSPGYAMIVVVLVQDVPLGIVT